jgi:hypothetical protein
VPPRVSGCTSSNREIQVVLPKLEANAATLGAVDQCCVYYPTVAKGARMCIRRTPSGVKSPNFLSALGLGSERAGFRHAGPSNRYSLSTSKKARTDEVRAFL